jgi:hypothetical protein
MEQCNIEKQNVSSGTNPTAQSSSLLIPLVAIFIHNLKLQLPLQCLTGPSIYLTLMPQLKLQMKPCSGFTGESQL